MLGHVAELHAVVREHCIDLIRDRLDQGFQETRGGFDVGGFVQLGEGDFGRRSTATKSCSLPSSVRTSAISMWK
jgi:hypothetical protein